MIMFKKISKPVFFQKKGHFFKVPVAARIHPGRTSNLSSTTQPFWVMLATCFFGGERGMTFKPEGTTGSLTRNHLKWWPEIGGFLPNCWLHHHFLWHLTLSGACLCCIRKPKGAFLKNTSTSFSSSGCLALEIPSQKKLNALEILGKNIFAHNMKC